MHVVCGRVGDHAQEQSQHGVYIHRVGFDSLKEWVYHRAGIRSGRGRVGVGVQKPGWAERLAIAMYRHLWKNMCFPDDAVVWKRPATQKARQLLRAQQFDALVTVSLPFTGHCIGQRLKRDFPHLRWLADVGDPFSFSPTPLNNSWLFGALNRRLEARVLVAANSVIVTHDALRQRYQQKLGQEVVSCMEVIPPLLSTESAIREGEMLAPLAAGDGVLRLGYFGAMYSPVRTPDALLDVLSQAMKLHPMLSGQVELHFFGEVFPEFYDRLIAHPWVRLHGLRSREEVQDAMRRMDVLVNIGNSTDFQLPSKVVDYLAAGRPVMNVSYTQPDPFADFLSLHLSHRELLFNLKVKGGRVEVGEVQRWIEWLGARKPLLSREELAARLVPFEIGSVAAQYLQRLQS